MTKSLSQTTTQIFSSQFYEIFENAFFTEHFTQSLYLTLFQRQSRRGVKSCVDNFFQDLNLQSTCVRVSV